MDNKGPPSEWTKLTQADWDRATEQTRREGQARFDRTTDEDWLKEIEQEPDGPITMGSYDFLSRFSDSEASPPLRTTVTHRESAMSKLGSWIAKKLAFGRSSDIRHP